MSETKKSAVAVYVACCTFAHGAFLDFAPAPVPSKVLLMGRETCRLQPCW